MPGRLRTAAFFVVILAWAGLLPADASPFNPVLDVFVSSPAPSANSNVRFATSLPAGNPALGTWSLFLPAGWNVSADNAVSDGDVVARATMAVDTDCNGSIDTYGPFNLVDTPVDPGPDHPVAQWTGQIASWWTLVITVDQVTGYPYDVSADLTNFSVIHTMCAPQNFIVTVLGRSSPHNDVVLTNPSSAGAYTWTGSFGSFGGQYITNVTDSVCIGNTCDFDGDTVADVSDNCIAWPNPAAPARATSTAIPLPTPLITVQPGLTPPRTCRPGSSPPTTPTATASVLPLRTQREPPRSSTVALTPGRRTSTTTASPISRTSRRWEASSASPWDPPRTHPPATTSPPTRSTASSTSPTSSVSPCSLANDARRCPEGAEVVGPGR